MGFVLLRGTIAAFALIVPNVSSLLGNIWDKNSRRFLFLTERINICSPALAQLGNSCKIEWLIPVAISHQKNPP